jgi:hypothetical protein
MLWAPKKVLSLAHRQVCRFNEIVNSGSVGTGFHPLVGWSQQHHVPYKGLHTGLTLLCLCTMRAAALEGTVAKEQARFSKFRNFSIGGAIVGAHALMAFIFTFFYWFSDFQRWVLRAADQGF